ncbi:GumC family protein [Corallococcus sp. M7]
MFSPEEGAEPGAPAPPMRQETGRSGHPIDPLRIARVLQRRWRVIAGVFLAGALLSVALAKTVVPREFTARTVLLWEPARVSSVTSPEREIQTLMDTLKLPNNLEELRKRARLPMTLDALARRLDIAVARDSNILTLSAIADSPEEAARLAEMMTQVFLDSRRDSERTRAEQQLQALTSEVDKVQAQLEEARARYDRFRGETGIADLTLDRQAAIEEAARLRTEMNRFRIEAESSEAKAALLKQAVREQPGKVVLSETESHYEQRKLAELRAELTARKASLSEGHPEVLGLSSAVQALESSPDKGTISDRVVGTNPAWTFLQNSLIDVDTQREVAQKKWRSYAEVEASVRDRIARLSAIEGQASVLLAQVQLTAARLADLRTRQKVVESEVRQPEVELRVLTPATPPLLPSKSYRRLVALLLPPLFALLATVALAASALRGLKLWTPAELSFWAHGPVVAATTWPATPEGLEELAADLRAALAEAKGTTLLLPLTAAQAGLARELSSRLGAASVPARDDVPEQDAPVVLWEEAERAMALRRAARQCDRVLVLVASGAHSLLEVVAPRRLLGSEQRIGLVVVGLGTDLATAPDRVGEVSGFWSGAGASQGAASGAART